MEHSGSVAGIYSAQQQKRRESGNANRRMRKHEEEELPLDFTRTTWNGNCKNCVVTELHPTWLVERGCGREEHDLIMQKVGLHGQTPAGAIEFMLLTEQPHMAYPHHMQRGWSIQCLPPVNFLGSKPPG
ncbi:hypothetical protein OPV22_015505 [Ensete ventricosum]|uniref:Uncharacterized protein n=1 Tax=Ensete ventricosum TaxID=4639 RepID=A0AAV8R5T4_ENSVE|nr:hypothetical protein OPV22_015505 [Ensete ventricosum]